MAPYVLMLHTLSYTDIGGERLMLHIVVGVKTLSYTDRELFLLPSPVIVSVNM